MKEADEVSSLSNELRMNTLKKILQRLLAGTKYSMTPQGSRFVKVLMLKRKIRPGFIFRKRTAYSVR